jgi:GT2 family glycosyltransferase
VCTFNRSRQLTEALRHIESSAVRAGLGVEIVVVDNNSSDDTKEAVARVADGSAVPVRYVFEPAQGLSFARNRGVQTAKGSVIAFTDDDCIVDPDWIGALWGEFTVNPDVAIVGGRVDLYASEDQPVSIRPFGERVRYANATQVYGFVMGCNMAIRRGTSECIGGFDPAFGGSKGVIADDIDFLYRALKHGLGILFAPAARVLHNHGRRSAGDIRSLRQGYVRGRGAFYCKHLLRADPTILRHAWWEVRAEGGDQAVAEGHLSRSETLGALASGALHFILTRIGVTRP